MPKADRSPLSEPGARSRTVPAATLVPLWPDSRLGRPGRGRHRPRCQPRRDVFRSGERTAHLVRPPDRRLATTISGRDRGRRSDLARGRRDRVGAVGLYPPVDLGRCSFARRARLARLAEPLRECSQTCSFLGLARRCGTAAGADGTGPQRRINLGHRVGVVDDPRGSRPERHSHRIPRCTQYVSILSSLFQVRSY